MSRQERPLQGEYEFYNKNKASFFSKYGGKFIVIRGEEVLGPFDTDAEAYKKGLLRFGIVPFFMTNVLEGNEKSFIPVLQGGLLDAGS